VRNGEIAITPARRDGLVPRFLALDF
jgi:hypothetical protein